MTCACEFSGWLREWLLAFGAQTPFMALAVLLIWWSRRSIRREFFDGRMSARRAIALNAPAVALFMLGVVVLGAALLMR